MLLLSLLLSLNTAFANAPAQTQREANLRYCTELINSGGYNSAGDQISCHNHFDMAPAYLIKCMSYEAEGFPTELDEKACALYLEDLKDWGPWQDYTPPKELIHLIESYRNFKEDNYISSTPIV